VIIQSELLCNVITHSLSNSLFCAFTGTEKHPFGPGAHLSAYPVGSGGDFPAGKVARG
jgi:hypothetical protein